MDINRKNKIIPIGIVLMVMVMAAVFVYTRSAYTLFTLVLNVRSLEKGEREVVVTTRGGAQSRIPIELTDDSGATTVYTLELPRRQITSIRIPPLASAGSFEVERIIFSSPAITYRWDGSTECRIQLTANPVGSYSPCTESSPAAQAAPDGSIVISGIAETDSRGDSQLQIVAAGLTLFLLMLCAVYLFRPVTATTVRAGVYAERVLWLAVIALYLWQLLMLWRYSVDLPFWEEWEFFDPAALQRGLTLDWLFCHFGTNQQVVVFTKLMAWLDFKLFNLDFARLKLMNYLVFGLFLLVLARFARQITDNGFRFVPLFMLFLLSPLAYEAHAASFQSGEIFVLLFTTLMLCYSAPEKPGLREACLFSAAATGAVFSMHTGVAVAGILLVCRSAFILLRIRSKAAEKRAAIISLVASWLITMAGIIYWFTGFRNPTEASVRLMPTEGRFWEQFLDLLSFGFGFETASPLPGILIMVFLVLPLLLPLLLCDKTSRLQGRNWQIGQAIAVLLAIVAMITFGRGATFTTLKLSRYTVYITPLILFGVLAWWLALKEKKALAGVLAALWIFCFAAFSNNWSYGIYRDLRQMDLASLECVEAYNNGSGDGNCPDTHGVPIGRFFENARKLKINFTRQFAPAAQPK